MRKVLFIANIGLDKKNVPNGVNIKNNHILKYLKSMRRIKIQIIDTQNWKSKFLQLFFKIFILSFTNHKIILSIDTKSAYQIIRFTYFFHLNKKMIYFVVGGSMPNKINQNELKSKYYKNILKIFVQTDKMKYDLQKEGFCNIEKLPNSKYFEDIEVELKEIRSPIKCFYLGRVHPDKGIDMIFESIERMNSNECRYTLDFYGPIEKTYENTFFNKINNSKFLNYNGIIDLMDNKEGYYKLAKYDLFVFPTFWEGEGFPGVVIDSFISGVPVLASDWNHNSEAIQDGYNGIIFQSKNINDLIDKLNYIDLNKSILKEMSRNAHKSANNYKSENILRVLDQLVY